MGVSNRLPDLTHNPLSRAQISEGIISKLCEPAPDKECIACAEPREDCCHCVNIGTVCLACTGLARLREQLVRLPHHSCIFKYFQILAGVHTHILGDIAQREADQIEQPDELLDKKKNKPSGGGKING